MIWLTARQFRAQAITAVAALAVIAIALGITGQGLVTRYDQLGLPSCHASCATLAGTFIDGLRFGTYGKLFYAEIVVMYAVPALLGIFWGAPLIAREFEHGTHRLAWNQSVSRTRWIAVKLFLIGLAAMVTAGLFSLMTSWWAGPIEAALHLGGGNSPAGFSRIGALVFDARGVAPLGYAAFAFALGAAVGVLLRRMLPAMAVTLAIFAAVQVLVPSVVRPHLIAPVTATASLNVSTAGLNLQSGTGGHGGVLTVAGSMSLPDAWILSEQTLRPDGQAFSAPAPGFCLETSKDPKACIAWLTGLHLRQRATYQPASRFWPLQWFETGIYLALAAVLVMLSVWQVHRRHA